jgi:hypothetical protein
VTVEFSDAAQLCVVLLPQLPPAHVQLVAGAPPEQTAVSVSGDPIVPVCDPWIAHPVNGPVPLAATQVSVTFPLESGGPTV